MKRRLFISFLALVMVLTAMTSLVFATETSEPAAEPTQVVRGPGECGEDLTWAYADGVLTVTGTGAMDDYTESAPWAEYKDSITKVVLSGVTYIGARAFKNYDKLESVDFGSALYEIGAEAFASCDGLTSIELPASFKIFGEGSFQNCGNLKEIHCSGRFPSFRENCLWGTYATIYYPADRPWGVEYIEQLETAFHGRIEFLASDGTDHYQPTEESTEPAETEPEVTEPETVPPTEQTVPVTQPPVTEPATEAPAPTETEATEAATEPAPQEQEEKASGAWIGIVIVVLVLCLIVLGALVWGGNRKKGRFSSGGRSRR